MALCLSELAAFPTKRKHPEGGGEGSLCRSSLPRQHASSRYLDISTAQPGASSDIEAISMGDGHGLIYQSVEAAAFLPLGRRKEHIRRTEVESTAGLYKATQALSRATPKTPCGLIPAMPLTLTLTLGLVILTSRTN